MKRLKQCKGKQTPEGDSEEPPVRCSAHKCEHGKPHVCSNAGSLWKGTRCECKYIKEET